MDTPWVSMHRTPLEVSSSCDTKSTSPTTTEYIYASQGATATGIALDNITSVNVLVVVVIPDPTP